MNNIKDRINKNLITIKKSILKNFRHNHNYVGGDNNKNTVLLIEPRFIQHTLLILANTYNILGDNWNYVFYCGKSFKNTWKSLLPNFIELRELEHDNFINTKLYSDFCKKKELWESLYGKYVLTIQLDTWIMNIDPYTIDFFISLNKSYIGGNMEYTWRYFDKINMHHTFQNFNGGLSLRNKNDMIKIIDNFPPLQTLDNNSIFLTEHEDVYFTTGCIKLKLPIGDDEASAHFSLHTKYYNQFFGIHQPSNHISHYLNNRYKYLKFLNVSLKLLK
jgi:hypothetical protein